MAKEPRRLSIPEDVARTENVPEDLDSSVVGPYSMPTLRRRRNAAWVYLVFAALAVGGAFAFDPGMLFIAGLFVVLAAWNLWTAWPLNIGDGEALEIANREAEFPVGHASAAVGFDGLRSKPIWNVLMFSADEPPSQRGLVRVDAVTGDVVGRYVEANPEV